MAAELADVSSIEEAAHYLRIEPKVVIRLARERKIGSLKIGRVVTFPKAALEEYVETHTIKATSNSWGLTDDAIDHVREARTTRK